MPLVRVDEGGRAPSTGFGGRGGDCTCRGRFGCRTLADVFRLPARLWIAPRVSERVLDAIASAKADGATPLFCAVAAAEPVHGYDVEPARDELQHILLRRVISVVLRVGYHLHDI